ncbi:Sensory transduction histidine kinases [Candidatus Nitrotoga sp. HW29]|uniref:XrtA/PEP-CTERM system histidine kinase PrsK n=1 Tax=Candidatus Nitrotoga sp. HW29 TaxID=2886963 RepID=UPI001EF3577D|nr:XrtA/PEP-CTERM system histidine kinase PrsK [Candidatus Nitrotoga sp. HW29]CAH1906050.1 Sensory transduction histidine kinases [Candidatus Nitrotoga sp. HW29]
MLTGIAVYSYGIAAIAFFILALLLLTSWRARIFGTALTVACVLTTCWAASIAYQAARGISLPLLTDILETLRNAGWFIFLLMLLGPFQQTNSVPPFKFKLKLYVVGIAAFYCLFLLVNIYTYWKLESPQGEIGFMTDIVGRVVIAVMGMLLVEQLYRNTPAKGRWGIKFACFGIGGMFAYDFYLYSDAMLFRQINMEIWTARGAVNALIVPLIAVSAARNPKWSLGISVSRRMLFHSATLLGTALYLLAMSAAGYYLRFFGGSWGAVMQVTFLFGAVALLVGILFSGVFRSWLKVFISKHFYNYNYDYREEWLGFTRTLSEHGHGLGERTIQAIAALVESPGGVLFISRESGNCEPVAHWNISLPNESESASSSFCQFLENKQWVIDLQEYEENPEKYGAIFIPQWLRDIPKGWLIVPLILLGKLFGFMILTQPRSKIKLNWEVIDLLKIAGSQAASYLAQQESTDALIIARQFESFNRMSTFIVHDLKNLVSQLSLLLSNAEKHRNNPEFQKDMLDTLDFSVQKMKLLLHKLSRDSSIEHSAPLFIDKLLRQTLALKSVFEPKPELEILDHDLMVAANWDRLERVIGHIIQNAVEATPRDGKVTIRILKQETFVVIEIKDTGQGMSEEFIRERLFKPFESTKSAGMGIGMFESREYIHELGGQIEVSSCQAVGTTFRVILPFHRHVDYVKDAA